MRTARLERMTQDGTTQDTPAQINPGDEIELEVGDIAHGGIFVARHEGRVVFVADAVPGELVRARVTEVRKSFARAVATDVLRASADRQPHVWQEAAIERAPEERAGGAELGHIRLARQRELKAQVLSESMARFAGHEWQGTVEPLLGDDENGGTRWRTRVTLHVDKDGRVGPYAARSHRVIETETLPLAHGDIEELAPLGERLAGTGRIELVAPAELDTRMRTILDGAHGRKPGVVTEVVNGREYKVDEDGFWQVHRLAAETLSNAVADALDPALVDPDAVNLDLYGGVGLLAAAFAQEAGPGAFIETVESNAAATGHATANLAEWRGASAVTARVDQYLARLERDATHLDREGVRRGTVILDPPRSGAGKDVIDRLAGFGPAQLVYVACDPVALARDTGLLLAHGYSLEWMRAYDLFPNTHHFETVARFVRV